jgi:hypothetical protein
MGLLDVSFYQRVVSSHYHIVGIVGKFLHTSKFRCPHRLYYVGYVTVHELYILPHMVGINRCKVYVVRGLVL